MSSSGSLEINADAIVSRSGGFVKRPIPILHRYSSVAISFPNTTAIRITTDTVNTDASVGDTGFVYEAPGRLRNTTTETVVCLVSYSVIFTASPTQARLAWIQVGEAAQRYGFESQTGTAFEPGISNSAIVRVPPDSYITVWCYQQSGLALQVLAMHGTPSISICLI